MGCCVLVIALIGQFFAWRRKIRHALGLPVADWDEDAQEPGFTQVWRDRVRRLTASTAGRAGLAAVVCAELAFLVVALPGPNGLLAKHREHFREAVAYVASVGHFGLPAYFCGATDAAVRPLAETPVRSATAR